MNADNIALAVIVLFFFLILFAVICGVRYVDRRFAECEVVDTAEIIIKEAQQDRELFTKIEEYRNDFPDPS